MAITKEKLAVDLFEINAVKFGKFTTKIGIETPIYFDFRVIVSYPELLSDIGLLLMNTLISGSKFYHICGVPYTALPIATVISVANKIPMLMRRKESKSYGTKKVVEGNFKVGDKCLIVEDVITSGSSILETVNDLKSEGLMVSEAVVLLDRQQGGVSALREKGIMVKSLFTINEFVDILLAQGKIDNSISNSVKKYIAECQVKLKEETGVQSRLKIPYLERAKLTKNVIAKELYHLMAVKKSNLCIAADLTTSSEILCLAEAVGPHICILKLHADILEDFSDNFVNSLKSLAKKHNFFLMEDRKYADIGNTVSLQYSKGPFHTVEWADFVTVHSLPGDGILKGIKQAIKDQPRGVFLLAEMSSEGNLITPDYIEETNKQAEKFSDIVVGFVCQSKDTIKDPCFIQFTPGVQMDNRGDDLGQKYNTPEEVILYKGADIAVVGRGIIKSSNPSNCAQNYREALWKYYEERTKL